MYFCFYLVGLLEIFIIGLFSSKKGSTSSTSSSSDDGDDDSSSDSSDSDSSDSESESTGKDKKVCLLFALFIVCLFVCKN